MTRIPRMRWSRVCAGLLLPAVLLFVAGCSSGAKTGTVNGDVTFDGQPLKEGRIQFVPIEGDTGTSGAVITDGKFTAEVPLTKMRVEINANKVVGKRKIYEDSPQSPYVDEVRELIPARYNVNSNETLDVRPGTQNVTYALKSK